ncbi:MAG TPA: hypothetical protein VIK25_08820 [Gemmatimonadaceae bacterium]
MSHENRTTRVAHSGLVQGIGGGVLGAFFAILLQAAGVGPRAPLWLAALTGAAVFAALFAGVTRTVFHVSGSLAQQLTMPAAKGTYAPQYSHIQALEVQEKYAEALAAWLDVARELPGNPSPLLRAADLQLRHLRDTPAALELFERARRIPGIRDEHVKYASQKIIDIHLAPGSDEGRALVELRRFITLFPTGREADGARAAIARIKEPPRDDASQ